MHLLNECNAKILIVDDDATLREALVFDFRRKAYDVFEADNGRTAYDMVMNQRIDLILSDVQMPLGNGIELLDRIKRFDPDIPVLMFISGDSDLKLEEAYQKGADAVFSKPFDRRALQEAVTKALLKKDERWSLMVYERIETNIKIDLRLETTDRTISVRMVNIARGGMFVALEPPLPTIGKMVGFEIHLNDAKASRIEGEGIVRWMRQTASENQPIGCGIEFSSLIEESRSTVIRLLNSIKTKAFIPS
jgi:CheY-like chemotaxis protein/Tfp pilus assembly protein PilZ